MYKQCVTQSARQRQRHLEDGLLSVMLHQQYEDISVSEFCDELGIPRKSFYRYFTNKDGALYALVDHALQDFVGEFFGQDTETGVQLAEDFFRYWLTKKDLLRALERNNLSGVLVQRAVELTVRDERFLPELLPDSLKHMQSYITLFLVSGITSLLVQWEKDDFKASPKEMAIMTVHLLNQTAFTK